MGTIHCPRCGKENPDELEVCQFCQARLKPLVPSSADPPDSRTESAAPAGDEHLHAPEDSQQLEVDEAPAGETVAESPFGAAATETSPHQAPGRPLKPGPTGVPAIPFAQPSEPVEGAGPLAGLRGLLAADADALRSRSPATRPTNLRISANQLVHVELLRELLEEEGRAQAQPTPSRKVISSEHIIRWGIALVLLLAVLWSVLSPGQPAPLPFYQEEAAELNRLVEQLPEGAPVLVAFDYEPALSAEMDTAAYAVLDHLMLKGAVLTLISTSATGPVLAERFMQRLWPVHHYSADQQYTNLGYVPGGSAGLASLARNLPGTLPSTIDGIFAWDSPEGPGRPPLTGIQAITGYSLILVLVDDADTARAWVEQLQPYLSKPAGQSGLVMVTSAQVEPIVWPYFDSEPRQVQGFVSGMRGGASYARLSGREDMPRQYWNAFGMGLFVAVLLMLVGGLFYVTYPMLAKPVKADSEAAE